MLVYYETRKKDEPLQRRYEIKFYPLNSFCMFKNVKLNEMKNQGHLGFRIYVMCPLYNYRNSILTYLQLFFVLPTIRLEGPI